MDEALLDVTSRVRAIAEAPQALEDDGEGDPARALAERIRRDVRAATRCEGEQDQPEFGPTRLMSYQSPSAYRPTSCLQELPRARPSPPTRSTYVRSTHQHCSPISMWATFLALAGQLVKKLQRNLARRDAASCYNFPADACNQHWAKRPAATCTTLSAALTVDKSSRTRSARACLPRST